MDLAQDHAKIVLWTMRVSLSAYTTRNRGVVDRWRCCESSAHAFVIDRWLGCRYLCVGVALVRELSLLVWIVRWVISAGCGLGRL